MIVPLVIYLLSHDVMTNSDFSVNSAMSHVCFAALNCFSSSSNLPKRHFSKEDVRPISLFHSRMDGEPESYGESPLAHQVPCGSTLVMERERRGSHTQQKGG